jgi:hypothetical protein
MGIIPLLFFTGGTKDLKINESLLFFMIQTRKQRIRSQYCTERRSNVKAKCEMMSFLPFCFLTGTLFSSGSQGWLITTHQYVVPYNSVEWRLALRCVGVRVLGSLGEKVRIGYGRSGVCMYSMELPYTCNLRTLEEQRKRLGHF